MGSKPQGTAPEKKPSDVRQVLRGGCGYPMERRMPSPWLYVLAAGLLEAGWALGLKLSVGFTRFWPSVATVIGIASSMALLARAAWDLPIGTAYAVWVGIGSAGAVILGAVFLGEPLGATRLAFLTLLIVAIVGLKMTAPN